MHCIGSSLHFSSCRPIRMPIITLGWSHWLHFLHLASWAKLAHFIVLAYELVLPVCQSFQLICAESLNVTSQIFLLKRHLGQSSAGIFTCKQCIWTAKSIEGSASTSSKAMWIVKFHSLEMLDKCHATMRVHTWLKQIQRSLELLDKHFHTIQSSLTHLWGPTMISLLWDKMNDGLDTQKMQ